MGTSKRNAKCDCGSNKKFKSCCSPTAPPSVPQSAVPYVDTGEAAVRWVICNGAGTALFADKDNRALVFTKKDVAYEIARLEDFSAQAPGEINVGAVGATKWAHLQERILFIELDDVAEATRILRERIALNTPSAEIEPAAEAAEEAENK